MQEDESDFSPMQSHTAFLCLGRGHSRRPERHKSRITGSKFTFWRCSMAQVSTPNNGSHDALTAGESYDPDYEQAQQTASHGDEDLWQECQ